MGGWKKRANGRELTLEEQLKTCRTFGDYEKCLKHNGGGIVYGGRHPKGVGPNGISKGFAPIPNHGNDDIKRGTRQGINKMLLLLFVLLALIAVVVLIG